MDYHAVHARNYNMIPVSKQYLESIATWVPGTTVNPTKSGTGWNIAGPNGHALRIDDILLDDNRTLGWVRAIAQFEVAVSESSEG